jgi:zinc/manganese transport system permease protein
MDFYQLFVAPFVTEPSQMRALVGMVALSIAGAPLGVFLMMRRLSLVGDAMSHAILPGVAVAFLLAGAAPLMLTFGGLVAAIVVMIGATFVARSGALEEDGALAVFSLGALSLGVTLVAMNRLSPTPPSENLASSTSVVGKAPEQLERLHSGHSHATEPAAASTNGVDIHAGHDHGTSHGDEHAFEALMFGSVGDISSTGLLVAGISATMTLFGLAFIWRPLLLDAADRLFLSRAGWTGAAAHAGFLGLVALALVAGFHALGALMALGLVIMPSAAAGFWVRNVDARVALSVVLAIVGGAIGLGLAHHLQISAGPLVVLSLVMIVGISGIVGPLGGVISRLIPARHLAS